MGERDGEKEKESVECMRPIDVARELGISRDTVIRLLRKKKIPGFKIGGSWMTRRCELEAYLVRLSQHANAAAEARRKAV